MRNTCRAPCLRAGLDLVDKSFRALGGESFGRRTRGPAPGRLAALLARALTALVLLGTDVRALTTVDLELVMAVDVSLSMDLDEQRLQRDGYVAAFRDGELHHAIASGVHGRIAVTYMEWAGPSVQAVVIPWTVIDGPAAARAFADRLAAQPISRQRLTSIGAALRFAHGLMAGSGVAGIRRVVDVSGDGPNNSGPAAPAARDELVAAGIVVNGLPIMLRTAVPGYFDLADLDRYYAHCVIGGPGAFMVPVREIAELKAAIRRKLLLEISGAEPAVRVIPVQGAAEEEAYDCHVGERQWRWYLDTPN
jgi:hypothetical protein